MFKTPLFMLIFCLLSKTFLCYDFNDIEFNKVLMDDLIEYEALTEDELPMQEFADRVKRDVESVVDGNASEIVMKEKECKRQHFGRHNRCCNDGFERSEEMKEIKRQCFAEVKKQRKSRKNDDGLDVFSCEKVEKNKESVVCAMECVAKKQGTLTDDSIPDVDAFKALMKKQYKEDAWQLKVVDEIVDICLADTAAKMALQRQNVTENSIQKCNPGPSIMAHCLWRQIVLRCPVELQDKSQQCQKMREKEQKKVDGTKTGRNKRI
uniref:CSON006422 protein n=1 Tax=Culicoides sonorensis TaxID=179676 RepID=A0A336N4P6_CULSO